MGVKIGEKGLDRWVADERRLDRIRRRIREKGAIALAILDLLPPPFPFTPFVLAAGALEVDPRAFFGTLAVRRIFRFGLEAALAVRHGRSILSWLDSDIFHDIVARASKVWYGPVRYEHDSEPYMRIAAAGNLAAAGV